MVRAEGDGKFHNKTNKSITPIFPKLKHGRRKSSLGSQKRERNNIYIYIYKKSFHLSALAVWRLLSLSSRSPPPQFSFKLS